MSEELRNKVGELLADVHTLLQQTDKKLYELEAFFVEAARENERDADS